MEPPPSTSVSISNASDDAALETDWLRRGVGEALRLHDRAEAEVHVHFVSESEMAELNARYRGLTSSTDVLTFPSGGSFAHEPLGELVISVPDARRQAAFREIPLEHELAYLGIHGALHLLGFEDETPDRREAMVAEMRRVAVSAGLPTFEDWHSVHAEEVAE